MSKLEEREGRRRSIIGSMVREPESIDEPSAGGRGRPRSEGRELKKRISLSVLPSLYEDVQRIAYVQRRSISEVIGELLEQYRKAHEKELQEYDRLRQK